MQILRIIDVEGAGLDNDPEAKGFGTVQTPGRLNQSGTVREKPEPRTIFWSGSGWHTMDHGPDHGEPDQKFGSNHGSGPDHGSTTQDHSIKLSLQ
jgi:hypothetical protein